MTASCFLSIEQQLGKRLLGHITEKTSEVQEMIKLYKLDFLNLRSFRRASLRPYFIKPQSDYQLSIYSLLLV